ncbi:LPS export ABC transporter periplasmic protein LptC [Thiofilum flexile]|uniref:LPS export ABC transporter periplasmic protein LptC n=1 Tax=Thiofilum flexile TaxID=125627 RepID=UPI0003A4D22B|nr:LPS export ABC transporter periplasmic protein LptC [Thiofilum flexile]
MKRVFFVVLILVAVLMLLDVRQYIAPTATPPSTATKPDVIDYYFNSFTLQSYNTAGQRSYEIQGQHLKHWQAQQMSSIIAPYLQSFTAPGNLESILQAQEAMLDHKNRQLALNHAVKVEYLPQSADVITLTTEQLEADLNNKLITTTRHVMIQSPEAVIQATGLEAKLNEAYLRLPANVQSVYQTHF